MQFTLDSVENFKASLEQIHKGKTVKYTPLLITDLSKLIEPVQNTYFFGVLTNGDNYVSKLYFDANIICDIDENSQIIEAFSNLRFYDVAEAEILNPKGIFRGFEINIR